MKTIFVNDIPIHFKELNNLIKEEEFNKKANELRDKYKSYQELKNIKNNSFFIYFFLSLLVREAALIVAPILFLIRQYEIVN